MPFMGFMHSFSGRRAARILAAAALTVTLTSCQLAKNQLDYDRAAVRDRQDFRDLMAPQQLPPEEDAQANIPEFQPMVATPAELRLPAPLVTVSVNQTVSLRDLMFELAHQADVDIELDPQIRGSIIFTARERPFDQVVDRICAMAGLRYRYENNVLRVELDRPYVKNYALDYISTTRSSSSSISTSISLSDAAGDTADSSSGGSSSSSVDSSFSGDVLGEFIQGLEQILTASDTEITLATLSDPVAEPVLPAAPAPYDPANPASQPPPLPGDERVAPMPAARAPTLNINTPRGEPLVPNAPATFSFSRQSGILTVFASDRQQRLVQAYIDDFRKRSHTQVLIEARVLQVELTDEFATGIDWNAMNLTGLVNVGANLPMPTLVPAATGSFTGVFRPGSDINIAINAMSRFGTVRALSSPRVTVLNNQPAIVNVAQNNVYFEYDVQITDGTQNNPPRVTVESTQKGIPEGVLMTVIPTADPDTGEILLTVRPSVSKITGYAEDPTVALALAFNGMNPALAPANQIPEVSVQEIDSVLRMQSGQTLVMGGLMRDNNTVSQQNVPILGELPLLGRLFSNHGDKVEKTELVIFIRAQIVGGSNVHEMDKKLYRELGLDRRPARM